MILVLPPRLTILKNAHGRVLTTLTEFKDEPLETVEIFLPENGQSITLQGLEKNGKLLGQEYRHVLVDEHGKPSEVTLVRKDCHYNGENSADGTSAAVSVCDGFVTALFSAHGEHYHVYYKVGDPHASMRLLQEGEEGMGVVLDVLMNPPEVRTKPIGNRPNGGIVAEDDPEADPSLYDLGSEFFVEIAVVNDEVRVHEFDGNLTMIAQDTEALVNQADLLFKRSNFKASISLVMTGQMFWTKNHLEAGSGVPLTSTDAEEILDSFRSWRLVDGNRNILHHDTMLLLSGKVFANNTVGLAYVNQMCDDVTGCSIDLPAGYCYEKKTDGCCIRNSVHTVSTTNNVATAAVLTHELGHLLGFAHDGDSQGSSSSCSETGYLMAPYAPETVSDTLAFSTCSVRRFDALYANGITESYHHVYACLTNDPHDPNSQLVTMNHAGMHFQPSMILLLVIIQLLMKIVI